MQTCIQPSWCHCHSLSLASVKSRLVLPFWYRLTVCVCVCVCISCRWWTRATKSCGRQRLTITGPVAINLRRPSQVLSTQLSSLSRWASTSVADNNDRLPWRNSFKSPEFATKFQRVKKVKLAHTRLPSVGFRSWSRFLAAYRRVYDSRHLHANCQEPESAPEPYARQ